jgi:hypothetical protein
MTRPVGRRRALVLVMTPQPWFRRGRRLIEPAAVDTAYQLHATTPLCVAKG